MSTFENTEWKNSQGKAHTPKESDTTAHKALKLAEELKEKMDKGLMKGVIETTTSNANWFTLIGSGIIIICMLGTATGRLYQNIWNQPGTATQWEIMGEMIVATVFLGIYLIAGMFHMSLGRYVIYYALFFAAFAFGISVFMNLVAVQSRILYSSTNVLPQTLSNSNT